ncbi:BnaC05g02650D [Brassica napus]|uniref:BnaC05g02650D protein n=1 Tax=Brassica napus TaxID=3708 RepID=A0A078FZQ9_BRANA|nr:BnaC05g02650D [Brassica napus]
MSMMFPSFQLLELNIISAQDLAPVSRKMKTYAVAWVHSERKLTTRVDYNAGTNPTWNDKFVFRVDEEFLYADTSAVVIEIYALHWFRDVHVGTVRVLISNLIPPSRRMRFVALQVRRASGRPQGILNIGVGVLDGSMRSMPLYTHMDSSAFQSVVSRSELRRTKSDTSSMVVSDLLSRVERSRLAKQPSHDVSYNHSSRKTPRRVTMNEKHRPVKARASPYLSRHGTPLRSNIVASSPMQRNEVRSTPMRSNIIAIILTDSELGPSPSEIAEQLAKNRSHANDTESSILSEWSIDETSVEGLRSKLERWRTELPPLYDIGSSQVSSTEYDGSAIVPANGGRSSRRKTPAVKKHSRRHTEGGNGLFSCFSKICGVECSFACGGGSVDHDESRKGGAGRVHRTYSADDLSSL